MSAMSDPAEKRDDDVDEAGALLRKAALPEVEPPPDFLADVQKKLHKRSGGKFYRSRWSTSPLSTTTQLISLVMLIVIVLIWLLAGPVRELGPDTADGDAARPPVKIRIQGPGPGARGSPPSPPPR